MPHKPVSPSTRRRRRALARRGIGVLALVLILHALVVGWATGNLGASFFQQPRTEAIVVTLTPAPVVKPAPAPPPVAAPARPKKVRPHTPPPPAPPEPETPPPPASSVNALDMSVPPDALAEQEAAANAPDASPGDGTAGTPDASESASAAGTGDPSDGPAPADTVADKAAGTARYLAPPSAELKFDVQALREGQKVYGSGVIQWKTDGTRYSEHGEASVLFFTVLRFDSTGTIDAWGVSPELYNEKRFRKAETNTHFHRGRNLISFSASTLTYPRQGGEQDRASVVWQIAAMAGGDPAFMAAGKAIPIFVAGPRDAETWTMRIVGEENLDLDGHPLRAWHVERLPKPGSYDQKIDIWFAPDKSWYPVRILYTEKNGEYLDMRLADIRPIAPS